jgi:hypothetical protein
LHIGNGVCPDVWLAAVAVGAVDEEEDGEDGLLVLVRGIVATDVAELDTGDTVMVERTLVGWGDVDCGDMGRVLNDIVVAGGGGGRGVGVGVGVGVVGVSPRVFVTTSILQSARMPLPAKNIPIMELLGTLAFWQPVATSELIWRSPCTQLFEHPVPPWKSVVWHPGICERYTLLHVDDNPVVAGLKSLSATALTISAPTNSKLMRLAILCIADCP